MNRSATTCITLAGLAIAYYALLGRGHLNEIAAHRSELTAAYARSEAAEQATAAEAILLHCSERLDRLRAELTPRLTVDPTAPPFLLTATKELRADGLAVERAEALPQDQALGRPNHRIRITVHGTLHHLFAAICKLENAPTPTRVSELSVLTGEGNKVRGEMTIVRAWSDGG